MFQYDLSAPYLGTSKGVAGRDMDLVRNGWSRVIDSVLGPMHPPQGSPSSSSHSDAANESDGGDFGGVCDMECGHGECHQGSCLCEIQFDGTQCDTPNTLYFAAFAATFFVLGAVCLTQLVLCVRAEFGRLKRPSLTAACRLTVQKSLYVLTCAAALLRALYFAAPGNLDAHWVAGLLSAFYAVLLSGLSLIVCFWAEVFHLNDIRWERPRFLSKSLLGFLMFNIITYSLLMAELILTISGTREHSDFFSRVFNGCYAVLLFIVVVFFLIYGVEVYFKVRGQFVTDAVRVGTASDVGGVNTWQLQQSRLGLVSQAVLLLLTAVLLFGDIVGHCWKSKVTLESRNVFDVVFRVAELGVALWFPCVLWNSIRPERLWLLNPKQILRKLDLSHAPVVEPDTGDDHTDNSQVGSRQSLLECWICYDSGSDVGVDTTRGQLIQPCECRGSTGTVHHECLKKWLMECGETSSGVLRCRVCGTAYCLQSDDTTNQHNTNNYTSTSEGRSGSVCRVLSAGFTLQHWLQAGCLVAVMVAAAAGCWLVVRCYEDALPRTAAVGCLLIAWYLCVRFLGVSCLAAAQRAHISSVKILNRRDLPAANNTNTNTNTNRSEDSHVATVTCVHNDSAPVCALHECTLQHADDEDGQETVSLTSAAMTRESSALTESPQSPECATKN